MPTDGQCVRQPPERGDRLSGHVGRIGRCCGHRFYPNEPIPLSGVVLLPEGDIDAVFAKGRRQSLERVAHLARSLKPVPVSLLFL
jgi:hypothetical protein